MPLTIAFYCPFSRFVSTEPGSVNVWAVLHAVEGLTEVQLIAAYQAASKIQPPFHVAVVHSFLMLYEL